MVLLLRDQADLLERLVKFDAAISPVNDIAQIFADPHIQARENIVPIEDEELGTLRMQDVVGKFSRTPGKIRSGGPRLGTHNREILVETLGFSPEELKAAGIEVD